MFRLSIPLRKAFEHAAHRRRSADPIVFEIELADGTVGYGETLPRPYVTGETVESVQACVASVFVDELLSFRPAGFPEALERIEALPIQDASGTPVPAARAGVELALLDAYSRCFGRPLSDVAGWIGLPGLGEPGSVSAVRYSGVLSGGDINELKHSVRKMRWFGLRDFKLKVGYEDDVDRVRVVAAQLGKRLGSDLTLRLDANAAWTLSEAVECLGALGACPIACVEQPLPADQDSRLPELKRRSGVKVMHDESLVTIDDADRLTAMGVADGFNIRISKNGGFLTAIRLAARARRHGTMIQLGCMVGETSILSAAGRRFLQIVPGVRFAEGCYGRFLLRGDVADRGMQFGCGGKCRVPVGPGWGIDVNRQRLKDFLVGRPVTLTL